MTQASAARHTAQSVAQSVVVLGALCLLACAWRPPGRVLLIVPGGPTLRIKSRRFVLADFDGKHVRVHGRRSKDVLEVEHLEIVPNY